MKAVTTFFATATTVLAVTACIGDGKENPPGVDGGGGTGAMAVGGAAGSVSGGTSGGGGVAATGGTAGLGGTGATGGTGGVATNGTGGVSTGGTGGTPGCMNAEECSDPVGQVCSPTSAACVAGECTATQPCPPGQTCLGQVSNPVVGACYTECKPDQVTTGCPSTEQCVDTRLDGKTGACFPHGAPGAGQPCVQSDLGTGCVAGHLCVLDVSTHVCRKMCQFFSTTPGCIPTEHCAVGGVCTTKAGDGAALGTPCSGSSVAGDSCASDGKAWRGSCQVSGGGPLTCQKLCRSAVPSDCGTGKACTAFPFDSSAGVCK